MKKAFLAYVASSVPGGFPPRVDIREESALMSTALTFFEMNLPIALCHLPSCTTSGLSSQLAEEIMSLTRSCNHRHKQSAIDKLGIIQTQDL